MSYIRGCLPPLHPSSDGLHPSSDGIRKSIRMTLPPNPKSPTVTITFCDHGHPSAPPTIRNGLPPVSKFIPEDLPLSMREAASGQSIGRRGGTDCKAIALPRGPGTVGGGEALHGWQPSCACTKHQPHHHHQSGLVWLWFFYGLAPSQQCWHKNYHPTSQVDTLPGILD